MTVRRWAACAKSAMQRSRPERWQSWRSLFGVLALVVALVGLQSRPALADDTQWTHIYESDALPYLSPNFIAADPSGVYGVGFVSLGPAFANGNQLMVQKLDSSGGVVAWTYQGPQGSTYNAYAIAVSDGAVYVTYSIGPKETHTTNDETVFVQAFDAGSGANLWTKSLGTLGTFSSVTADASGPYVTGATLTPDGFVTQDVFIRHYNTGGGELWTVPSGTAGNVQLSAGDGALYALFQDSSGTGGGILRKYDPNGDSPWSRQVPIYPFGGAQGGLAASGGGASILGTSSTDGRYALARYDAAGSLLFSHALGDDVIGPMAADAGRIYVGSRPTSPPAPGVDAFDLGGASIGTKTIDNAGGPNGLAASAGNVYVLGTVRHGAVEHDTTTIFKLRGAGLTGRITWSDAYPERVGQGVAGATMTAGGTSVTTDSQGNYTLPKELEGQQATVELPLFDLSGAQAATATSRAAGGPNRAAASTVTAKVSENLTLTVDPNTGTIKPVATFGKNVSLTALGQTVTLTNVKLTDQGLETIGGTTHLSFKYDPNSPPLQINATISYVKASNHLTITGVSGSQFQWGGQTATLDSFEFKSPQNTVTMSASLTLSLSGVQIATHLTGTGTADGVSLQATGQAQVQAITLFFDPITVENGQFHVKGHVKLPNQPVDLAFDSSTGFDAPKLILPLPQFQWDGQVIPLRLELLGSAMILAGEGSVQIGGQAVTLSVDTQFNALNASVNTVKMNATIPLPDGEATARLEYDPAKPQSSSVSGTLKIFLALCPGRKTDFNVDMHANAAKITLGFHTQVPVDCDGNGTSTLVDIDGSFDGQLAQLKASWPVTVGNVNGRVSATVKGDGTYVEILFNAELKLGPGGRSNSTQAATGPGNRVAAASDVRVLLTDGVGRHTGFDPATGQIVQEIPGGHYDGLVNGMDTFTMPGRVGGYAITLSSQVAQQVQVQVTVNGQPTTYTAQVGPGAGTTLAAEVVPQNGSVSVQIGMAQVGCAPRPSVVIAPVAGGDALQATFTAEPGTSVATNAIREIRIGQAQNGVVDGAGRTGLGSGAVITLSPAATSTTLTVRRVTPGQATTVPLVIVDGCGEWPTFVGGGPSAF